MRQPSDDYGDPVQVIRHAAAYLKHTRGLDRYNASGAKALLDDAETAAAKCIDYMLGEKSREKGMVCPCAFHQAEALNHRDSGFGVRDSGTGNRDSHEIASQPEPMIRDRWRVVNGKEAASGEKVEEE